MCDTEEQRGQTFVEYCNSGGAYGKTETAPNLWYPIETAPNEWHPIDTAPKNGEEIDLIVQVWNQNKQRFNRFRVVSVGWHAGLIFGKCKWRYMTTLDSALSSDWIPTHWMRTVHPDGKPWNL